MNDFLNNLLARSFGVAEAVQPRLASLFEPASAIRPSGVPSVEIERSPDQVSAGSAPQLSLADDPLSSSEFKTTESELPPTLRPVGTGDARQRKSDKETDLKPETSAGNPIESAQVRQAAITPTQTALDRTIRSTMPKEAVLNEESQKRGSAEERAHRPREAAVEQLDNPPIASSITTDKGTVTPLPSVRPAGPFEMMRITHAGTVGPITPGPDLVPAFPSSQPATSQNRQALAGQTQQTIKVTIGRIDVRAIMSASPARRSDPTPKHNPLSLDEYLKQRSGGRR